MQVGGHSAPIVTRKGTRPASPSADCIFHILMYDATAAINQVMAQQRDLQSILTRADLPVEAVVWADDIAIPLASSAAETLPSLIENVLHQVHSIFHQRGFAFNMQKGKTSVVATFKGLGAPLMRARYQLIACPGMHVQLSHEQAFVHFVPCYKHLGTIFSSSHTLDQELSLRIGMATSAFAQVSAPILCNRHLPEPLRLRLFKTLIESKLFFWIRCLGLTYGPPDGQTASCSSFSVAQAVSVETTGGCDYHCSLPPPERANLLSKSQVSSGQTPLRPETLAVWTRNVAACTSP